ncbi:ABC transporter permease [Microvirga sp. VF16]|uniref:ABC transporter permease n=1 Tax=Microvirga sp. VF16 TaxID=2807101 RepID=UPI00193EBB4F|nr:ABC transporter permease [Microvirga sp. VF16]QRM33114.1 ABC transporter permease [Microvirga sp. VF16]
MTAVVTTVKQAATIRGAGALFLKFGISFLFGLALFLVIIGAIYLLPMFVTLDGLTMAADAILAPPSLSHPAGTDHLGRDVFVRVLLGGQSTLALAVSATILGVGLGTILGMVTAFYGGLVDKVLMRLSDTMMAMPSLVLTMLIVLVVGAGSLAVVVAITIIFIPRAARVVRSAVLNVVHLDFVSASAVMGESTAGILFREILPNVWPNILVEACLRFSYAILLISSLGYLGLGVQPPTPDWGIAISEAAPYFSIAPWMILAPAFAIILSVICVNLLGDSVQEWLGGVGRGRMVSHV